MTPPTALAFPGWENVNLAQRLSAATGCATTVANDADVACLAEMYFGAGKGRTGGDGLHHRHGIGSALFTDGHIVPNTELGRLYLRGRKKPSNNGPPTGCARRKSWVGRRGERLNEYSTTSNFSFWPDVIIIGGGVSKKHEKFFPISLRADLLPASLRNEAGIVGAPWPPWMFTIQPWDLGRATPVENEAGDERGVGAAGEKGRKEEGRSSSPLPFPMPFQTGRGDQTHDHQARPPHRLSARRPSCRWPNPWWPWRNSDGGLIVLGLTATAAQRAKSGKRRAELALREAAALCRPPVPATSSPWNCLPGVSSAFRCRAVWNCTAWPTAASWCAAAARIGR